MFLLLLVFFYDYFSLSLSLLCSLVLCLSLTSSIPSSLSRSLSFSHILSLTHALFLTCYLITVMCFAYLNAPVLSNFTWCVILFLSFSLFLFLYIYIFLYHFCFHSPFVFDLKKRAKLETSPESSLSSVWCYVLGTI